ncbi:MAG TPA: hypothetical protein VFE27_03415 [Acidobacteriaceae bacterium]|jgi:DNA-binding response OmpR family regulator|nr:hypothetical protein [Acidobacteriaceae bacterium]
MSANSALLLCVGNEQGLMELRCAVLEQAGYRAKVATPTEAESLLRAENFHLIVLSAWVSEDERIRVIAAAGDAPIVALEAMTFPQELLCKVACLLANRSRVPPPGGKATPGLSRVDLV